MPYDENAWVLRDIASKGHDLEQPRLVDFEHIFPDVSSAQAFAEASSGEDRKIKIWEFDDDTHPWNVTVSKVMIPTCENITDLEENLDAVAQRYGGQTDGWGFFNP